MKKRILFVDDERKILEGLQRMLRVHRSEWDMEFAASGSEALETLRCRPCDVLITDMRMPGMDGCQLLRKVRDEHPNVVRIILSGHSDKEMILNSVGVTHQFLAKPCDAGKLMKTVARACSMRDLLENKSLIDVITKIDSLPSLPSIYKEILEEVNSPEGSLNKVSEIISMDAGMSAKLLQLVNSAFFGLPAPVNTITRAVSLLGMETIKALVLSIRIFSGISLSGPPCYSMASLWDHSLSTGLLARSMATQEGLGQSGIDESFMAGLLHDIGKLILVGKLPDKCIEIAEVMDSNTRLWNAEQQVLGTTHAQLGAYLLGIWGLTESIVEAVAYHHCPSKCPNSAFDILTVIHLADSFEHGKNAKDNLDLLDRDYLAKLGLTDRVQMSY